MEQLTRAPKDIGHMIRRVRKQKGLTQAGLAEAAGVWQRTVSNVENDIGNTKLETILNLLAALDLELVLRSRSVGNSNDFENIF